jgi:hypothetical protein
VGKRKGNKGDFYFFIFFLVARKVVGVDLWQSMDDNGGNWLLVADEGNWA